MTRPTGLPRTSTVLRSAVTAGALALLLTGCASGSEAGGTPSAATSSVPASSEAVSSSPASPTPSTSSSAASSMSPTPEPSTPTPSAPSADVTVDVRLRGGKADEVIDGRTGELRVDLRDRQGTSLWATTLTAP